MQSQRRLMAPYDAIRRGRVHQRRGKGRGAGGAEQPTGAARSRRDEHHWSADGRAATAGHPDRLGAFRWENLEDFRSVS